MVASESNPFAEHYLPKVRVKRSSALASVSNEIAVLFSATLDADLAKWKRKGYSCLGLSDVLSKAGAQGVSPQLNEQAGRVGASVVLFCAWPAKVRSVRRGSTGEIDLEAVVADPPATFSPRGYAVTRALFLAKSAGKRGSSAA